MHKIYIICFLLLISTSAFSQKRSQSPVQNTDSILLAGVNFRNIGPFRGGRSGAVAGDPQEVNTFYFGATGGGVWKTQDGGSNWKNISDKYFGGSIGAVAVAPSDPTIIYAGEGEGTLRGNVSEGFGMWRSDNSGKTWTKIGLEDSRHILRIIIHPKNPDIIWVAAMGHLFGPNKERGVYKSTDGGKHWQQTLYVNEQTGCSDLVMEPGNPDVLYAGMWRMLRTPYSMESGGAGSGLFKSTDGGATWKNISSAKGLPAGMWGIVGVAVAPSNTDKLYCIIENKDGGLFMSNDAGKTWELQSKDNSIRQRAWYYSKVFVDPKNENAVYVLNVDFLKSTDAGKTFQDINTPHGDHHDLWIDPKKPERMIIADDGGAQVSFNGGDNWSTYMNQPTAQFYRVSTDNHYPYRILGAQQDNSTIRILSRSSGSAITQNDWQSTAGAESGYVVADPLNPDVVYGGNYSGYLSRLDHRTGENRAVSVWPDDPLGGGADVSKYRFQWNFPIFFSPHDPKKLYAGGNQLFVTTNEGADWKAISPDLTTNDKERQRSSGGPITKDNTGVEVYCTIFTATESALEKDLLWTGSDDGLIHVSKDGGNSWSNVTPAGAGKWMMWNCVETDPFVKGKAYFAGTKYKEDDFRPYLFVTTDYGKSWTQINNGIAATHFTRAIRADKKVPGLLYAGTEYGLYMSRDAGNSWKPFQQNLPIVPITDMTIKNNDLIIATQGRAFWVLDDLSVVQKMEPAIAKQKLYVYPVEPTYRYNGYMGKSVVNAGTNITAGPRINFHYLPVSDSAEVKISIQDRNKKNIRTFSNKAADKKDQLEVQSGMNQFVWDMQYAGAEKIDKQILWHGNIAGIQAPPGDYYYTVNTGKDSSTGSFKILANPTYSLTQAEYEAQFKFLDEVKNKFDEIQKALKNIQTVRKQMSDFAALQGKGFAPAIKSKSDSINKKLTAIEETLHQTKAKSGQDVLNYPIRLDDKISGLFDFANSGYAAPASQVVAAYAELAEQADVQLKKLDMIMKTDVQELNKMIKESSLPVIGLGEGK